MARIRLNLKNLSVNDKIAKDRQIVTAMTNNANFPSPNPPLAEVTADSDELTQAFALVQSAKSEVTSRVVSQDNAESKVDQALTKLANHVESIAGRDDALITSARMETKAARSAPSVPGVPQAVGANAGDHEGEIELFWKPVANAQLHNRSQPRSGGGNKLDSCRDCNVSRKSDRGLNERKALLVSSSGSGCWGTKRLERAPHESCTVARRNPLGLTPRTL